MSPRYARHAIVSSTLAPCSRCVAMRCLSTCGSLRRKRSDGLVQLAAGAGIWNRTEFVVDLKHHDACSLHFEIAIDDFFRDDVDAGGVPPFTLGHFDVSAVRCFSTFCHQSLNNLMSPMKLSSVCR